MIRDVARGRRGVGAVVGLSLMACGLSVAFASGATGAQRNVAPVARSSRVIPIVVVRRMVDSSKPGEGRVETSFFSPNMVQAVDGDVLEICNRTSFFVGLFSLSRDNHLGTGGNIGHPKPVKERPGWCRSVTVHNPTGQPFTVKIYNEYTPDFAQGAGKLFVTVAPSAPGPGSSVIVLEPGLSTARMVRIPVAPGPDVFVVVSGLITQVQAGTGRKFCYDAFWGNSDAGCASWTGNGGSNGIWVGPPGWTGDIAHTSQLASLIVPGGVTPAFSPSHVYRLKLNLTGKQLLWAVPHLPGTSKDTWSGNFKLDFTP
jgi:hypothetical protein